MLGHGDHAAMEAEALPLVNILGLKEDVPPRIAPPAPAVSYSGSKHGATIHVVRNGGQPVAHLRACTSCFAGILLHYWEHTP